MSAGFSHSSSKSSTTSQNYDQRAGADNGSIAASGSASVTIDATSPEAFDFAGDVAADVIDLTSVVVGSTFGALSDANKTVGAAMEAVRKANTSETANTLEMLIKIGVPVLGAAFILPAIFKK